jgi:tetratricopeptide (TPR) repeat protein
MVAVVASGCSSLRERLALSAGNKLYKSQKYEEAIQEYQKILASSPDHWDGNYMIAVSYLALYHPGSTHDKDLEYANKAVAAFEKLMSLKMPDTATRDKVRGYYVGLLQQSDQMDKAAAFYDQLMAEDPNNLDLLAQAAQLAGKRGDFDKALELYQKRADIDPVNKEGWYTLGVLCWERSYKGGTLVSNQEREQIVTRGIASLGKALAIDPEYMSALAYTNLLYREKAKVLVENDDLAGAQAAIGKADEYQKMALAILNKNRGAAAQAPPKPGA